jgi:hypothetical protein
LVKGANKEMALALIDMLSAELQDKLRPETYPSNAPPSRRSASPPTSRSKPRLGLRRQGARREWVKRWDREIAM